MGSIPVAGAIFKKVVICLGKPKRTASNVLRLSFEAALLCILITYSEAKRYVVPVFRR